MKIITLMTDFGIKDGNVGVMKGVIWGIAPDVQIADISHTVGPQNIHEAALLLARSVPYFPDGSIHVVVVDPGVGTARRPIAAKIGGQSFVLPDNGIISMVLAIAENTNLSYQFFHLDKPSYWRENISNVFHGRDILAPVSGHLALGVPMTEMGTCITDPVLTDFPLPKRTSRGWRGEIIHVDHFGNLSANILSRHLEGKTDLTVHISSVEIEGLVHAFGEKPPGTLVALLGSNGNLIISEVNGNAADRLGVRPGEPIDISF